MNDAVNHAAVMVNTLFTPRAMDCTQAERRQLQRDAKVDAAGTISDMQKECAIMNQTCQRIVVGPHGMPTIKHGEEMPVELTPDAYLAYKCEVGGLVSPLAFQITCPAANDSGCANLEAYFSASTRKPNKAHHELKFLRRTEFRVRLEDIGTTRVNKQHNAPRNPNPLEQPSGQFVDDFIYIGLKALNGCSVTISFSQADIHKKS